MDASIALINTIGHQDTSLLPNLVRALVALGFKIDEAERDRAC